MHTEVRLTVGMLKPRSIEEKNTMHLPSQLQGGNGEGAQGL